MLLIKQVAEKYSLISFVEKFEKKDKMYICLYV